MGFYVPSLLIHWVPKFTETPAQVLSFAARFGIAYVLLITAWLSVAFFAKPAAGQKASPQTRQVAVR